MKELRLKALAFASFIAVAGAGTMPASAADIAVIIDGIEVGRGLIKVAFCDRGPLDECHKFHGEQPATSETMGFRFDAVPAGVYAFVGYQDFDSSGENERNMFGMPQEPFALGSGDVKLIPPPEFEDVAVEVRDSEVEGAITVIRLTLRTLTKSLKKKGAPTVPWEEVPLLTVPPPALQQ